MINRILLSILVVVALNACASTNADKSMLAAGATVCEDPRPQVCTMDYRPVCGTLGDGTSKSYANGCGACADAEVRSWIDSTCPE